MGLINLLFNDPLTFVLLAIPLLYSIIIHELAHGWVAYKMGDPTAKWMGRLTLNPLSHLDPLGTLMLFLVGFGWAKPVPVNFSNIRDTRLGLILVSSAGIIANMIGAFIALLILEVFAPPRSGELWVMLNFFALINIILAAFNLIPIPPLDGSKILMGFLPENLQAAMERFEPYGFFVIIGLLFLGVLNPLIDAFRWIIVSIIHVFLPM